MKYKRKIRNTSKKIGQAEKFFDWIQLSSNLRRNYYITIFVLTILSVLSIAIKSDKINSNSWGLSVDIRVSSVTLILVFLFWLPIVLPLILDLFPQLRDSLDWLREQGVEEVETNLLRIKLRYGVQEASQDYEEKIWNPEAENSELSSEEAYQQLQARYQQAISIIDSKSSNIAPEEALSRIDQLATYYDRLREEMPSGHNRTRLLREVSSIMWTLVPKVMNFPIHERLNSNKGGERLSAYKYIEWNLSTDYIDLLVARAVGILEVPFAQYAALLTLRRVAASKQLTASQSAKIIGILNWSANLDYIQQHTKKLMLEIVSILETQT